MKTFRKVLKLFPPAFAMRIWLDKRYGIKVRPSPWRGVAGFALALLPYAFTAVLSVRVDSDVRLLKYFLPYGRMKKFVKLAYGMQRSDATRDHGAIGALRSVMPYGLVIWWDAEDARIMEGSGHGNLKIDSTSCEVASHDVGCRISDKERQELQRMDKIEAMTLRLAIIAGKAR